MNEQCLACHREIAFQVERGLGLHGRERSSDCASCHPDHAGEDFELIAWIEGSPEAFDHDRSGWPLDGRHAALACRECHNRKLQRSEVMALAKRTDPDRSWLGLTRECASCHLDPHQSTLGADCAACHSETKFSPAPGFDHAAGAYPLTGKHADVKCEACHLVPGRTFLTAPDGTLAPRYRPVDHQECSFCHRDLHEGRLGPSCAGCHVTQGFAQVESKAFDHSRTRFPLRGGHAPLACEKCHDPGEAWGKRPRFDTCGACHEDAHAGKATVSGRRVDCGACHDERAFRPSTYTVSDHAASAYPLLGKHASVRCEECHPKRTPGADSVALGPALVVLRPPHGACRDCHAAAHGEQLRHRDDGGACEACHRVDGFKPSTFTVANHALLKLPLEGDHARAECAACHGPRRRDLPPLPELSGRGKAAVVLSPIDPSCVSCHVDPHGGRFAEGGARPHARGCLDCHSLDAFAPSSASVESHAAWGYPLEGAHRAVPCFACHQELRNAPPSIHLLRVEGSPRSLPFRIDGRRCADCHATPHGDQFAARADGGACETCHTVDAFRPASRFDHDRDTDFALLQGHAGVACARCHAVRGDASGKPVVIYRPTPRACRDCHVGRDAERLAPGGAS
jgi:hypothetical protein